MDPWLSQSLLFSGVALLMLWLWDKLKEGGEDQ